MKKRAEAHFLGRALSRELKKWKAGEIGDLSWLNAYAQSPALSFFWEAISSLINEDLKSRGLWHRDGDGVVVPEENGVPSLKKRKSFEAEGLGHADESIYDPEALDEIYREARIVEDDQTEEESPGEATGEESGSIHPYLPRLAVSSSHALMRRYPLDLKESLARDLFDSYAYSKGESRDLLPALCFFEVGISDQDTFQYVWEEAYKNGPFHKHGKKFTFQEFQKDKLRLFHRLKAEKERYFRNPWVKSKEAASIWARFEVAYGSLTRKQWNALKQVRVKKRKQTEVARDMRISLDSLRNRLEAAELKFRRALPELAAFFPSTSYRKSAKANYIYDGLFDKRERASPLYRIDPKTGVKAEIPLRKGKIRQRSGVNTALIKAWAHDSTPVPDFSFTEFFTQLYPKGAIDRQSAGDNAPHDKASGMHSFSDRIRAHKKKRPSPALPDDERSDD